VQVVGMESVTVPAGTFNCYKVEYTNKGSVIFTEWWSADGEFIAPVKIVDTGSSNDTETKELKSYTPAS